MICWGFFFFVLFFLYVFFYGFFKGLSFKIAMSEQEGIVQGVSFG